MPRSSTAPSPTTTHQHESERAVTRLLDPVLRPTPIVRWLDARVLAAGVAVVVVRWWFALDRRVFHVVADEPGQLAMARWLAGGTRWNMFDHSTWRPGYSALLAPAFWLVDTGEGAVRAALTLNAVLAGVSAAILVRLLSRWTITWTAADRRPVLGPWACAVIATAVALAPAAIAASAYTWAEAMVTCTFLATLWWTQRFVDTGRLADALAATFAAAVAMTTHGRSLALLPTVVLITAGVLVVKRRRYAAAAVAGYGALLGVASLSFTDRVHGAVWDEPGDINTPGTVIERLDAPVALLDSLVGQTWYQLVASVGMVGIGAGVVLLSWWRPARYLDRRSAAVLVALIAPLVLTSVTFMADRERADQLVYGRYVDAVVWPLAAIGVASVVRLLANGDPHSRRSTAPALPIVVASVCVLTGLIVAWRHGDQLAGDVGLRMMVPGLLPYIGSLDGVPVLTITAVAGAIPLAIAALVRRGAGRGALPAMALVLVLGLAWSGLRVHDAQSGALNAWDIAESVARVDRLVPEDAPIGVVIVPDHERPRVPYVVQRQRYQIYQLYLPDREVVWERTPQRPTTTFVFAPAAYPPLLDAGGRVVWGDPAVRVALWELPDRHATDGPRIPSPE